MNKISLTHIVKKKNLLHTFFLYCLFSSISGFAQNFSIKDYVYISALSRVRHQDGIEINANVYNYLGQHNDQFLQSCTLEASFNNVKYFKLMEIFTPQQSKSNKTTMYVREKLESAIIQFDQDITLPSSSFKGFWPNTLRKLMSISVPNLGKTAIVGFTWYFTLEQSNICYIRVSGLWRDEEKKHTESFNNVIYNLNNPY